MIQRCGNCRFWELSAYGERNGVEGGVSGPGTDGSVSNCRRRSPAGLNGHKMPSDTAEWPMTKKTAWCGQWEART